MKAEFTPCTFGESDADTAVMEHPEWFVGAGIGDARPGQLTYHGPQNVGVHIVEPIQGADPQRDGVIIIPRSYEAAYAPDVSTDPRHDLEAKRDAVIANVLGKMVVGVDTPGFGLNPDAKPRAGHILTAVTGSMVPHAKVQLEAIVAALKHADMYNPRVERGLKLELLGYSMGNIAVVDMLSQLDRYVPGSEVANLTLVEAVSDQNFNLIGDKGLLSAIARETNEENTNRYFAQNARNGLAVGYDREEDDFTQHHPDRESRQSVAKSRGSFTNLSIGAGMWRGWASRLAPELAHHNITNVRILRTNGSEVAREAQNNETALYLAEVAPDVSLTTVVPEDGETDHHHTIWQSLPAMAVLLHELSVYTER